MHMNKILLNPRLIKNLKDKGPFSKPYVVFEITGRNPGSLIFAFPL